MALTEMKVKKARAAWAAYTQSLDQEGRSVFVSVQAAVGAAEAISNEEDNRFIKAANIFLSELDAMIEATEEFIADDGLLADHDRIHDLSALLRTRELYISTFGPEELREQDDLNQSQS